MISTITLIYIGIFLFSFAVSFFMVPKAIKFANAKGIIDNPKADNRRVHTKPTPRAGGIAIVTAVMLSLVIYYVITALTSLEIDKKFVGYILGGILIASMGLVDDMKNLKPLYKFLFQLVAGMIIYIFGISIVGVKIPFIYPYVIDFSIWAFPITLIWVLGITNAVNLIDGLDGLATGISTISTISLLVVFTLNGASIETMIIAFALVGATLGFLPYNFNPAKTFMGDVGSNFLGYTLATISIMGMAKGYTVLAIVIPIIIMGVPVFDMIFAIVRRLVKHQKLTTPDKGHIHHRLLKHGYSQRQAVFILYSITTILGIIAVTLATKNSTQWWLLVAVLATIVLIGYVVYILRKRKQGLDGGDKPLELEQPKDKKVEEK